MKINQAYTTKLQQAYKMTGTLGNHGISPFKEHLLFKTDEVARLMIGTGLLASSFRVGAPLTVAALTGELLQKFFFKYWSWRR